MYEARQNKERVSRVLSVTQWKNPAQRMVLQRAILPKDFIDHEEDTENIKSKMKGIDGGADEISLNSFINGTDFWAKETRLAALRKYNEMETALRRYDLRRHNVWLGINTVTDADIQEKNGCCEVKTVNGKISQLGSNILNAFNQLFVNGDGGRVQSGQYGIAYIYLTDYYFDANVFWFGDAESRINEIAKKYVNKDPGQNRTFSIVINYKGEEHVYCAD